MSEEVLTPCSPVQAISLGVNEHYLIPCFHPQPMWTSMKFGQVTESQRDMFRVFSGVSRTHFSRAVALFGSACCQGCCQRHEIGWRARV